jgi:leucyl aminopeptidase
MQVMKITFQKLTLPKTGGLVLGVMEGCKLLPLGQEMDAAVDGLLTQAMKEARFNGKDHESLKVATPRGTVLLYGLGSGQDIDALWAEKAGGSIFAVLAKIGLSKVNVLFEMHEGGEEGLAARAAHMAFAMNLRAYRFDKYKTQLKDSDLPSLQQVVLLVDKTAAARRVYAGLQAVAEGVYLTRDLVSEPPNVLYPESYAKRCAALTELGVKVEVLGEKEMKKLGMGALLGVGQGSVRESKIVVMHWNGATNSRAKPLAFIGKGVTFDTGGISLKPAGGMEDMKWDMGGSGTVVGLMHALAGRNAKVNVIGIIGLVENMPDGNAQRPGDVVTSMSGQTIEVINTDAEGRLVLADVLHYTATKYKPAFMIDLATLTGAMMVSLGQVNCGYFANDDALSDKIAAAGKATGEGVWRMPLGAEYNKQLDSDIADMKNVGPRWGGAITAACFLERFVGETPWAHMDIAGMAWASKDSPTVPKGGTGWGVRLLNRLVEDNYE